jgi:hypothetical protein
MCGVHIHSTINLHRVHSDTVAFTYLPHWIIIIIIIIIIIMHFVLHLCFLLLSRHAVWVRINFLNSYPS